MRRVLAVVLVALVAVGASGAAAVEAQVQAGAASLFARRVGSGPTLLTVHGGPGVSSDHLRGLERLAGRSVVTWDQRGVGRSAFPTDGALGFEAHVADLEAVRAWTAEDKVDVLGHSWGALVAAAYAAEHPDRVRHLVIVNGAWPTRDQLQAGWERVHERETALLALGAITTAPIVGDDCTAWLESFVPVLQADATHAVGHPGSTCDRATLLATWQAVGDYDITDVLAKVQVPTVILHGEADPYGDTAGAYARAMPAVVAKIVRFDGCGHRPMHECPAAFDAALEAALK